MLKTPPFQKKLTAVLDDLEATPFADGGVFPYSVHPGLSVANVGIITLPLQQQMALRLLEASRQAPFGRGPATIIDRSVRNCRQIDASEITLSAEWHSAVQDLAMCVGNTLGVFGEIEANLYKLVLYESGGFFKCHRDTEKEPGMFGTLVVQLPSWHKGGALVVRKGAELKFRWSGESQSSYHYAAFFADCEHELEKVEDGYRLVLLYNLVNSSKSTGETTLKTTVKVTDNWKDEQANLVEIAEEWSRWEGSPCKLALVMEHQYTMGNVGFGMLKGKDKVLVDALQASEKFHLYLALVEKKKKGSAEEHYWDRDPYEERDEDSEDEDNESETHDSDSGFCDVSGGAKMIEHIETNFQVIEWIDEEDEIADFPGLQLDIENDMIGESDPFENCSTPDDEEYEATGNEGATVEYIYHRAVLVIWPRSKMEVLRCATNISGAIENVLDFIERKQTEEANRALGNIIKCAVEAKERFTARMPDLLEAACVLENRRAVHSLLTLQAQPSMHLRGAGDNLWLTSVSKMTCGCSSERLMSRLVNVIKLFGWKEVQTEVMELVQSTPSYFTHHCAKLALALLEVEHLSNAAEAIAISTVNHARREDLKDETARFIIPMMFRIPCCLKRLDETLEVASKVSARALSRAVIQIASGQDAMTDQSFILCFEKVVRLYIARAFGTINQYPSAHGETHVDLVFAALIELRWKCDEILDELTRAMLDNGFPSQLRAILQHPKVTQAAGNRFVSRLAAARVSQLRYPKPVYTHRCVEAEVPGHPEVTAFLRSEQERMVYRAFGSIKEARNFASQFFGNGCGRTGNLQMYSAEAIANGRGRDSQVEIWKTRTAHNAKMVQFERDQQELVAVQFLITGDGGITKAPARKRLRTNKVICIPKELEIVDLTSD